jgi:hypothetical protein
VSTQRFALESAIEVSLHRAAQGVPHAPLLLNISLYSFHFGVGDTTLNLWAHEDVPAVREAIAKR